MNHILQRGKIVFSKHIFKRQDKKNFPRAKNYINRENKTIISGILK
jgi:hypothetical protein